VGFPQLPGSAQNQDEESARAFVDFYFALLSYAMQTGEAAAIADYSRPDCQSCSSIPGRIRNVYDNGLTLDTRGWFVEDMVREEQSGEGRMIFFLRVRESPSKAIDESGKVASRTRGAQVGMRIVLDRDADWMVR